MYGRPKNSFHLGRFSLSSPDIRAINFLQDAEDLRVKEEPDDGARTALASRLFTPYQTSFWAGGERARKPKIQIGIYRRKENLGKGSIPLVIIDQEEKNR